MRCPHIIGNCKTICLECYNSGMYEMWAKAKDIVGTNWINTNRNQSRETLSSGHALQLTCIFILCLFDDALGLLSH